MNIAESLKYAVNEFRTAAIDTARLDAVVLLTHALAATKEQIIFNQSRILSIEEQARFLELVKKRCERVPVAQLVERKEFYGRDFYVNEHVLTPRPDSETLIELVKENSKITNNFLEIGVGSGCLIITLLKLYPEAQAFGIDISAEALAVTKKNAKLHDVTDRLILKNTDFALAEFSDKFDLVISNPPYIPSREIINLEPEVRVHEPGVALDGGEDGLEFYRLIAAKSAELLKPNGMITLEIGIGQKNSIEKIFALQDFKLKIVKRDLAGIERALLFTK